ncbi:MAG: TIGR01777 family oxidoreductase [Leptolinea sp.]
MALVLISGGNGLIGKALVHTLNQHGHKTLVLTRNPQKTSIASENVYWDGIHPEVWTEWVGKADWIINLAGENIGAKLWTFDRLREIRESRVFTGELLTEAVLRSSRRPSVFLQMSAIGYYGVQRENDIEAWDETQPSGNDRLSAICRDWEGSSEKVESLGVRRLVARTGLVLARKGGVLPKLEMPFTFFGGGPVGSGRQVYSWIHIDDLVEGMLNLLENPKAHGAYNFTAPNSATNAEFGKSIGQVLHRPYWLPVPAFAFRLALGEMSTLILDGQRVVPGRLTTELGFQFIYPLLLDALKQIHSY